jgi:hypothetical protein
MLFRGGLSQETTGSADLTAIIQQLSESVPSCAVSGAPLATLERPQLMPGSLAVSPPKFRNLPAP